MGGFVALSGLLGFAFLVVFVTRIAAALVKSDWHDLMHYEQGDANDRREREQAARDSSLHAIQLIRQAESETEGASEAARANAEGLEMAKLVEKGHSASEALRILERGR